MDFLKHSLLAAFVLLTMSMSAATLDAPSAQARAYQFLASHSVDKLNAGNSTLSLSHVESSAVNSRCADYYVFNSTDGKAFVIVAGDDRAEEILGYGEGSIDMTDLPCNLQWWLDQYKEQIEFLIANPDEKVEKASAPRRDSDGQLVIAPMLTCNWSQSEPYYNMCPLSNGERCVTGCVATAMAQVMYYWRYPDRTNGVSGYWCRSLGTMLSGLPATTFEWDDMLDSYAGEYTKAQGDAVAKLMRYCGQSCNMGYSPDGSGAYVPDQLRGMKLFGYNPSATMLNRSDYELDEWADLLIDDLQLGYPVLYSGNDPMAGGHAFVLDGYHDGKYHINWGWAATGNGYFALGAFNVRTYSFNANVQMLHRIYPSQQTPPEYGSDFEHDGIYYKYNEDASQAIVTYFDTHYDSYEGQVVIPSQVTHDGKTIPVTGIGNSAFRNSLGLESVTIPATVKCIEDYAFRNCIGLIEIEIPSGVESIGNQAFANCMNLERVAFSGNAVKTVGEDAFMDCNAIKQVEIGDALSWLGMTFVSHYSNPLSFAHHLYVKGQELEHLDVPQSIQQVSPFAFIECEGLKSVLLEDGVTDIGTAAFSNCISITSVTLPQTMTAIGKQVFFGCSALAGIDIPENIITIGNAAFSDCSALEHVKLPSTVTTVCDNAFANCKELVEVVLPNSVTDLGASAFSGCSSLSHVRLSTSLTTLKSKVFYGCSKLSHISIPSSVTHISTGAFQKCSSLTSVIIPDNVTQVGDQAFSYCSKLTDVTIGKSVGVVGDKAFINSRALAKVTCRSEIPPLTPGNDNTFTSSVYDSAILYVPESSLRAYKNSGIWPWFKHIEIISEQLPGDVNGDGEVNISDVSAIIDIILNSGDDVAGDVNGDGEINIVDINAVIDLMLS